MYLKVVTTRSKKVLTFASHILVRARNPIGAALRRIGRYDNCAITGWSEGGVVHPPVIGTAEEAVGNGCWIVGRAFSCKA